MSLSTFIKLVNKAFRFTILRTIQRYNIENRAKKFLGPNAKYFMPAPRALGAMSQLTGKPPQYPHLDGGGYKSIEKRRLEALENKRLKLKEQCVDGETVKALKAYSETENDDNLVISASAKRNLEVNKTITLIDPGKELVNTDNKDLENSTIEKDTNISKRSLPKCTNLPLQELACIWKVERAPHGRISLESLQELLLNKLADEENWTPARIAEKYKIKEEYADEITQYLKQIRVVVSPKLGKLLDYTGRDDPIYQASKHIVYHVDKRWRDDIDKKYDDMFLPGEVLDEEVSKVIDPPETKNLPKPMSRIIRAAEPLRVQSANNNSKSHAMLEPTKIVKRLAPPQNLDSKRNLSNAEKN